MTPRWLVPLSVTSSAKLVRIRIWCKAAISANLFRGNLALRCTFIVIRRMMRSCTLRPEV